MASHAKRTSDWVHSEVMEHEADLRAILRRKCPTADIDDIVQEAYCRLSTLSSVGHIDCPRAYLFRTAFNVVLEMSRGQRRLAVCNLAALDEALIRDDSPSPERIVLSRAEMRRVKEAFDELPPRRRTIVWMRRVDGMPQREIARMLDLPEHIVENDASRGVRQLRRTMSATEQYA